MRVCYFGTYDETFPRNKALIRGLVENGVEVVRCHSDLWSGTDDKISSIKGLQKKPLALSFLSRAVASYLRLVREHRRVGQYDAMLVGYAGHVDMFAAWMLSRLYRKPLAFDLVLSLYSTVVEDRKLVQPGSRAARMYRTLDKLSCSLADMVFLDTQAHIEWFSQQYNLPKARFRRVMTGIEPVEVARNDNRPRENGCFRVLYFGSYIPALHGVEHILRAAVELRDHADIQFELVGEGQSYQEIRQMAEEARLTNVRFVPRLLRPSELATAYADVDVSLGHFGTGRKAGMVIPQKIIISLALGLPVLTRDSPAVREVFSPGHNVITCEAGDAHSLASALLALKSDPAMRNSVAMEGQRLFHERLCPEAVGAEAKRYLSELCARP